MGHIKFLILFLLSAALLPFLGCKPKPAAAVSAPPEVQVVRAARRDEPIYTEWVGTADGLVNAQVRAQISGYLLRQHYTEGGLVKAGDLLFDVDPRPFQAAVDMAMANAAKAEADYHRIADLAEQQVVSKQDLDSAVANRAATRATLAEAELNLEFTQIKSPIDGIAGIATAQIGDLVGPASGILTTVSTVDPIKVYFPISEQTYLQFRHQAAEHHFPEDMEFELILSDDSLYPLKGKFFAADRQIDPNTGTLRIAATFPNPDRLIRPGQYAHIRAVLNTVKNALELPQRAVNELQGAYQIAVVGPDNVAHLRPIKVGPRVGSRWIITEGLKPDEDVIVEGLQKVHEGTVVSVKRPAASNQP